MSAPAISNDSETEPRIVAGKYLLEALLAEGGMGQVWRAVNLQLELPVALKLLRAGQAPLGERLRLEARLAAPLIHPGIVRIFDIGEAESGEPFIVMELLRGQSLGEFLAGSALSPAQAVRVLLPIAEALSLAHGCGIVHRDLKPDNIFLAREHDGMQPKLLDFGIAKATGAIDNTATVTQSGTLVGSPEYMSPEQAAGQPDIDPRSDVWSFCVVLYESIAGQAPFSGTSVRNILESIIRDSPPPLAALCEVDPWLARLVMSGLSKDRAERPATIFELGRQLAAWLSSQGVHDDITGGSLEVRWLHHASKVASSARPSRVSGAEITLLSARRETTPLLPPRATVPTRRQQRLRNAAATLALGVAGAGWLCLTQRAPEAAVRATAANATPEALPTKPSPARAAPDAPEASPLSPTEQTELTLSDSSASSLQRPLAHSPSPELHRAAGAQASRSRPTRSASRVPPTAHAPEPAAASTRASVALPRALPRAPIADDLLEPY